MSNPSFEPRLSLIVRPIMKRAAIEKARTIRAWEQHLAGHDGVALCHCEFEVGIFRKGQRVGGCGKARCSLCHGAKCSRS